MHLIRTFSYAFAAYTIILSLLFVTTTASDFFNPFTSKGPVFHEPKLHNLDVGLKDIQGIVAGIGDFNRDKYSDLFVLACEYKCVEVYLWEHDKFRYEKAPGAFIREEEPIMNIAAGDFNYDGKLDLLVTTKADSSVNEYKLKIYYNDNYQNLTFGTQLESASDQVLVYTDSNNRLALFGNRYIDSQRAYWQIDVSTGAWNTHQQPIPDSLPKASSRMVKQSSFVDIDGDCLSDLVIMTCDFSGSDPTCEQRIIEVWLNHNGTFVYDRALYPPLGSGMLSFADMDRDGTMDMVFPVCYPLDFCTEKNYIAVVQNEQIPLCSSSFVVGKQTKCRSTTALCTPASYNFNMTHHSNTTLGSSKLIQTPYNNNRMTFPPIVRLSDLNLDGFPDMMVSLMNSQTTNVEITIFESTLCSVYPDMPCSMQPVEGTDQSSSITSSLRRRMFLPLTGQSVEDLIKVVNPYTAFTVDFDETGLPDVIVANVNPETGRSSITTFFNNFYNDGLFLKTLGLSGACINCDNNMPRPYGVNAAGVVVKFTVTDLSGERFVTIGTQLSQSTHLSLQTPYNMFGLGRTNSYIEEFFVGIPLRTTAGETNYFMWVSIIPNSQLITIPYPLNKPSLWTLELYVSPAAHTLWVGIAFLSTLILLGIPIIILTKKEKIEDEKEKQETAHLFSFDAM